MRDPTKYKYKLLLLTEANKQYDISEFAENLGWEELEKELAARISFTVKNDKTAKGRLSSLAKPGCYVGILFSYNGSKYAEAVRGKIVEWNPSAKASQEVLKIKAYDELYDLQESSDNIYFSDGVGTKSAITQVFNAWKIPLEKYTGPDVSHSKLKYSSEKLGAITLKILEEAKKKGAGEAVVRSVKGKVHVLAYGSNENVYHFAETENLTSASHRISTSGMITRVKVLGEEDDDDRRPIEATLDGQTKYGIRQKLYNRGSDDSLADAKAAAQEILEEEGKPEEEVTLVAPDIPVVRKGDLIHLKTSTCNGYYYVISNSHSCEDMEMTMKVKKAVLKETGTSDKKQYNVGDIVQFKGGTHYVSSYPDARGYRVGPGKAKITIAGGSGKAHPWHLVTENWAETHVWGWVDEGSFE